MAKSGISETSKKAIKTAYPKSRLSFSINDLYSGWYEIIKGSEAIKRPLAGVGTPIKDSDWRVSMLNLAKRKAEKTTISPRPIYAFQISCEALWISTNNIEAGKSPKVITSASESNSLPMGEEELSSRATKPSKKSKTPPAINNQLATSRFPLNTSIIPKAPQSKLQQVRTLGIVKS